MTELKKCKLCGSKGYIYGGTAACSKKGCGQELSCCTPEEWNILNDDQAEQVASWKERAEKAEQAIKKFVSNQYSSKLKRGVHTISFRKEIVEKLKAAGGVSHE